MIKKKGDYEQPFGFENIAETKYKLKQEYVCMDRLSNISSKHIDFCRENCQWKSTIYYNMIR